MEFNIKLFLPMYKNVVATCKFKILLSYHDLFLFTLQWGIGSGFSLTNAERIRNEAFLLQKKRKKRNTRQLQGTNVSTLMFNCYLDMNSWWCLFILQGYFYALHRTKNISIESVKQRISLENLYIITN